MAYRWPATRFRRLLTAMTTPLENRKQGLTPMAYVLEIGKLQSYKSLPDCGIRYTLCVSSEYTFSNPGNSPYSLRRTT